MSTSSNVTQLTLPTSIDARCETTRASPDGRRLLTLMHGRLVLRSADGCLLRRLPADGFEPSWSPDGSLIAYLTGRCVDPRGKEDIACADLWVIRPVGTGRRRLAAADVDLTLDARKYAWAPDSRRLVYTETGGPGWLVVVAAWDGRKRTLGGTRRVLSTDPSWSPDGRLIAFSRQRGPFQGSDLYVVDSDGTRLRRLARGSHVSRATWSPDGAASRTCVLCRLSGACHAMPLSSPTPMEATRVASQS